MVTGEPLWLAYVGVFGLAAAVCFASLRTVDRLQVADTRRGLAWLLGTVGVWALSEGARLLVPSVRLSVALYTVGLLAGLASVGAWLYLCSAYTGREYHRNRVLRRLAVVGFLAISAVKLTNPWHGWYFSTQVTATPFPHVAITPSPLHWVVLGLAYALSAVGFFMLFDLFAAVEGKTGKLAALVGISGLPVVANLIGATGVVEPVIGLNYEPVGVAALAVGALFVADDDFLALSRHRGWQVVDHLDEAVVILDDEGRVRAANATAERLVPGLREATEGTEPAPLGAVAPEVGVARTTDGAVRLGGSRSRWITADERPLTRGGQELGCAVVLADVSDVVEHRDELERQNEQLEAFAAAITHELRNALNIVTTRLDLLAVRLEEDPEGSIDAAGRAADRAARIVDDLATLARKGQTVETTEGVPFRAAVEEGWAHADAGDTGLTVEGEGTVEADRARFVELVENAAEFAAANGADRLTVTLHDEGFTVADDGDAPPEGRVDDLFTYGEAVPDAASGMVLPVVETLATVHGWTVTPDPNYDDGVRYHVGGVNVQRTKTETETVTG
jgi:signal transduction histidine kinase